MCTQEELMYVLCLQWDSDLKIILQLHIVGMSQIKSWRLQTQLTLDAQWSQKHHERWCLCEDLSLQIVPT